MTLSHRLLRLVSLIHGNWLHARIDAPTIRDFEEYVAEDGLRSVLQERGYLPSWRGIGILGPANIIDSTTFFRTMFSVCIQIVNKVNNHILMI